MSNLEDYGKYQNVKIDPASEAKIKDLIKEFIILFDKDTKQQLYHIVDLYFDAMGYEFVYSNGAFDKSLNYCSKTPSERMSQIKTIIDVYKLKQLLYFIFKEDAEIVLHTIITYYCYIA